jgi:hypothetical protein
LPAHIRAEQRDLAPDDRTYIQRKLGTRLGKFARSIERISVRTDDANGPRSNARCGVPCSAVAHYRAGNRNPRKPTKGGQPLRVLDGPERKV